ncbi:MAG TPA: aromatic ring-hydroxylating dioxygenase subunit alpha [Ramlibacter sp.]|uniref:aromatic ring-hydroxylating dioxygenase subunit alpha n=1 Tax=Ramlibacter sp. TaxID=1917967 RepID=UPI002CD79051|nr:aromatic ring-hydroxylating dioxygenase subunit alpha [Ramlibacter sp.]HVZ45735.1 aromatic ring-hydroxylating dioxygenase subunit alpha [Ramlibacter sp.]
MFMKNCWYVAAWSHELKDNALVGRTLLNEKVLLYRGHDDNVVAIEDRCCHRGAPLSLGRLEGNCVRCMYHGLLFDGTGACIQIPGQERIAPNLKVKSYRVVDGGRLVWIWMGDPALADESTIPDFPYLKDPLWHGIPDYLHYDASYLLIADNLADLNHIAYVHTNTLGGSEKYAVESEAAPMERLDDGFRLTKWHMNTDLPPFVRKFERKVTKVDRWNTSQMKVPGYFFLESGFSPAGTGIREGNREGVIEFRNFQAMTPETDGTTHFFWVYMHNRTRDIERIAHSLHDSILEGFHEDKVMIETQQKVLDADPSFKLKAIASDAPLSHLRWLIEKRIREEAVAA